MTRLMPTGRNSAFTSFSQFLKLFSPPLVPLGFRSSKGPLGKWILGSQGPPLSSRRLFVGPAVQASSGHARAYAHHCQDKPRSQPWVLHSP